MGSGGHVGVAGSLTLPAVSGRQLTAVACLAAGAGMMHLSAPVMPYDGGISASSGTFIRHGLVPYRDFWLLCGPLSGYLVAAALLVAPPTVGLLRALGLATVAAQATAGYALIRDQTTSVVAAAIAVLAAAAPMYFLRLDVSAWPLAMAFALPALVVARSDRPRAPLVAGLLVGATFLSRLDVGGYVLISLLLVYRKPATLAGFLVVAVPFGLVLMLLVPVGALFEQLVWYPLVGTQVYRAVSLETSLDGPGAQVASVLVGWLPRAAILLTGGLVALRRRRGLGALTLFALLCQLQTLGRADLFHLAQAAGPALLLTAAWFPRRPRRRWAWSVGFATVASGQVALLLLSLGWLAVPTPTERDLGTAVDRVRSLTASGETIFVGLTANRYTYTNALLAYYLADRPPGTTLTMYNPGITNTEPHQRETVRELSANGTRVVLLDRSVAETCDLSNQSCAPGSEALDNYLAVAFVIREDYGDFVVATEP